MLKIDIVLKWKHIAYWIINKNKILNKKTYIRTSPFLNKDIHWIVRFAYETMRWFEKYINIGSRARENEARHEWGMGGMKVRSLRLSRNGKRLSDTAKKYRELMARVMLVIRKIVDRRAYNRANIVNLIPALTYRANHFSSLARSFAITSAARPSVSPFSIRRSEGNLTRKLHFPRQRLRLKPASSSLVIVLLLQSAPRHPQRTLVASRPWNLRLAIFVSYRGGHIRRLSLRKYGPRLMEYYVIDFIAVL